MTQETLNQIIAEAKQQLAQNGGAVTFRPTGGCTPITPVLPPRKGTSQVEQANKALADFNSKYVKTAYEDTYAEDIFTQPKPMAPAKKSLGDLAVGKRVYYGDTAIEKLIREDLQARGYNPNDFYINEHKDMGFYVERKY